MNQDERHDELRNLLRKFEKALGGLKKVCNIVELNRKVDHFMATVQEQFKALHDLYDKMGVDVDEIAEDERGLALELADVKKQLADAQVAPEISAALDEAITHAQAIETRLRGVADAVPAPVVTP